MKVFLHYFLFFFSQINEEVVEKILEINQQYSEVRKPIYDKRQDVIKSIPDFWLTAVSIPSNFFPVSIQFTVVLCLQHNLFDKLMDLPLLCSLWVILFFVGF